MYVYTRQVKFNLEVKYVMKQWLAGQRLDHL